MHVPIRARTFTTCHLPLLIMKSVGMSAGQLFTQYFNTVHPLIDVQFMERWIRNNTDCRSLKPIMTTRLHAMVRVCRIVERTYEDISMETFMS